VYEAPLGPADLPEPRSFNEASAAKRKNTNLEGKSSSAATSPAEVFNLRVAARPRVGRWGTEMRKFVFFCCEIKTRQSELIELDESSNITKPRGFLKFNNLNNTRRLVPGSCLIKIIKPDIFMTRLWDI